MKRQLLFLVLLFAFGLGFSQTKDSLSAEEKARREKNIQAGNPFKEFGYKPKIATLSKGKYLEFHDLDSIVKIGSFSYHVKNKTITGYTRIDPNNSEAGLSPEVISRWMSPDPLSEEFPSWSPYSFTYNNPIRFVDPDGRAPVDWIKNRYGDYLWDDNAVSQATTRQGWEYVGKELPQGTHPYQVLTEVNGNLYHKNTNNLFSSIGNFFGGDFVEHKPYDPVGEKNLKEGINTGLSFVAGNYAFKGINAVVARTFSNNIAKNSLVLTDDFMKSALETSGKQNQGLTNVARQLQKHAGREGGAFNNIKFSHKTGNEQAVQVLNDIMSSKNLIIEPLENGGKHIFDQATKRGFGVSRNGLFNGFRELKN